MTTYFQFANRFVPATVAKSAVVNGVFDQIVTGFSAVDTDITAIRVTAQSALSGVTAATQAAANAVTVANAASATASGALLRSGGTMTGPLTLAGAGTAANQAVTLSQLQAAIAAVSTGGGGGGVAGVSTFNTRSGAVTLSGGDVTTALGFVPANAAVLNGYAALAGAAFVGPVTLTVDAPNGLGVFGNSSNNIGISLNNANSSRSWSVIVAGSSGPASTGALGFYDNAVGLRGSMDTAGAFNWLGSITVGVDANITRNLGVIGTIYSSSNVNSAGPVIVGDGALTTKGAFYLTGVNPTTPIINFDGGDFVAYDRTSNVLTAVINGSTPMMLAADRVTLQGEVDIQSDAGGGVGGLLRIGGPNGAIYLRINSNGALEFINGGYSTILATLSQAGDFTVRGVVSAAGFAAP